MDAAKAVELVPKLKANMLNDKIDGSDVRNKNLLAGVLSMLNSLCGMSTTLFYVFAHYTHNLTVLNADSVTELFNLQMYINRLATFLSKGNAFV